MSSKSKTLFQALPKCSQVPADEVSLDSGTLTLLLKMRAVGCLIPQCARVLTACGRAHANRDDDLNDLTHPTLLIPIVRILFLTILKGLEGKEEKSSQIGGEWKEGRTGNKKKEEEEKIRSDALTFTTIDLARPSLAIHAI